MDCQAGGRLIGDGARVVRRGHFGQLPISHQKVGLLADGVVAAGLAIGMVPVAAAVGEEELLLMVGVQDTDQGHAGHVIAVAGLGHGDPGDVRPTRFLLIMEVRGLPAGLVVDVDGPVGIHRSLAGFVLGRIQGVGLGPGLVDRLEGLGVDGQGGVGGHGGLEPAISADFHRGGAVAGPVDVAVFAGGHAGGEGPADVLV